MSKIIIGLSLILLASNAGAAVTTAYFVPFDIETFVPITQENIISEAFEKWTISSKSQTSSLVALLSHGIEGQFDGSHVRLSVSAENKTFFVDAKGVASTNGKTGIYIDKSTLAQFRDSLTAYQRKILHRNKDSFVDE
jgi:hypothetical protein